MSEKLKSRSDFYIGREQSWLRFNERVLLQADAPEVPLLERMRFCAIFTSNLDEFFMVRVGSLTDKEKENNKKKDSKSGMTPSQQLDSVYTAVRRLQPKVEEIFRKNMEELEPYGFEHVAFANATSEEQNFLNN